MWDRCHLIGCWKAVVALEYFADPRLVTLTWSLSTPLETVLVAYPGNLVCQVQVR